ncbi:MAG TPA: formyl transferase [Thermoanaerobaculia bacterium]|nr:formyl transferase [Thermoanaerobaculia bacterium]
MSYPEFVAPGRYKKIVILRSDDAHHLYLERLLRPRFEVAAVVVEPAREQRRRLLTTRHRIDWLFSTYHLLRRRILGLDAYRWRYFSDLEALPAPPCRVLSVGWINDPAVVSLLRETQPDLTITICTSILKQDVLAAAGTIINVHGGFLPYYRGNHCFFFPFYRGEFDKIGSTLHFVDPGIDTGDIIENIIPPIYTDDIPEKLYCRAEKIAIHRLVEWIEHWQEGGELPRCPQLSRHRLCRTRDRKPHHDLWCWLRRVTGRLAVPELPGPPLAPLVKLPTQVFARGPGRPRQGERRATSE